MMKTTPPSIVLNDKRWLNFRKSLLIGMSVLGVVVIGAAIFTAIVIFPGAPWEKLPALLTKLQSVDWAEASLKNFHIVIMTLVLGAQLYYFGRAQKLERLTLSPTRISYTSPLPAMLKNFQPDWSLSWRDINEIEINLAAIGVRGPEFAMLTLVSSAGRQNLFPDRWVDAGTFKQPIFRQAFRWKPATPEEIVRSVMATPVARYIAEHHPHIPFDSSLRGAHIFTSLEKDPHGKIALGIVALLMLYAFVDFLAGPDAYAELPFPQMAIFIVPGIVAAVLSGVWLMRSALRPGEKAGLAFLIGMLAAVAMVPGALRLNALTDTAGPAVYDYHVSKGKRGVTLSPVAEGMPTIDYFSPHKYWDQFGSEDIYPVQLRKGALGFYQFNASAIVDRLRKYDGR